MTRAVVIQLPGIDGRFVLGMTWRHEESRPKARRLRELAEQHGAWSLVKRTSGAPQIAFCEPVEGSTARQVRSLADAIADAHVAPWRGMFALAQGQYWYVAVGAGHEILPDGDRVGSAEELEALRREHTALASWSEQEGTVADLARYVAGIHTSALREVAPGFGPMPRLGRLAKVAVGATALVVLGVCGVWYYSHQAALEEQERDAGQRRAQALAALAQRPTQKEPPPPWAQVTPATETFDACRLAWSGQALATRGWSLRGWSCATTAAGLAVQSRWGRETGDAIDAPGVIDQAGEYALNAERIEITWKPSQRSLAELPLASDSKRRGWALAQRYGVGLAVDKRDPDGTKLPGDEADHPEWLRHRFIYTLPMAPWFGFGSAFDALGGLHVRSITADLAADTWVIDAVLYARPDPGVPK